LAGSESLTGAQLEMIEQAVAAGSKVFSSYQQEPVRGAWWGRLPSSAGDLFVKGRLIDGSRRRWASMVLPRGLRREWRNSLWHTGLGMPCAEPLALGEYRSFGALSLSVLVTRWVANARTLADAGHDLADTGDRLPLIHEAGVLFGELFDRGAIHKQFHPWNVLVVQSPDANRLRLLPVDLQHLWISRRLHDEDFRWALRQVSFWLHAPVIDWSDPAEAREFYSAALAAALPSLRKPGNLESDLESLVSNGRQPRKLKRSDQ